MKNKKNKLFQELKLENSSIVKVIGGLTVTTDKGSDTNNVGGGYDIRFDTYNDKGQSTGSDTYTTSPSGTTDKPSVSAE